MDHAADRAAARDTTEPAEAQKPPSKLTVGNLDRHTTGENVASVSRTVNKFLSGLPRADSVPTRPASNPPKAPQGASVRISPPPAVTLQTKRIRELSNGSGSLPKSDRKSQSPIDAQGGSRPRSKGSQVKSMQSRHSLKDEQDKVSDERKSKSSHTPVLKPRIKDEKPSVKLEKGKGKAEAPVSPSTGSMSTSSDDSFKRKRRAQGLSDKSDTSRKKQTFKKRKKDTESAPDASSDDGEAGKQKRRKKQTADVKPARPTKKPAKEQPDADREQVLSRRKEKRQQKAAIVKDRSTVTAASKKAKAKLKADTSKTADEQAPRDKRTQKKRKRPESDEFDGSQTHCEYEDDLDITTAGKEAKRKKLSSTARDVKALRDAGQASYKDPLRRASNMPAQGRMTLGAKPKSGIYQNGHASAKVKVGAPPPDLAFDEAPFLDQQYEPETSAQRISSSSRARPSADRGTKHSAPYLRRDRRRDEQRRKQRDGPSPKASGSREPSPELDDVAPRKSAAKSHKAVSKSKSLPWMAPEYAPPRSAIVRSASNDRKDERSNKHAATSSRGEGMQAPIRSPDRRSVRSRHSGFSYRDHSVVMESKADISSDFDALSAGSLARRKAEAKERSEPSISKLDTEPQASTSRLPADLQVEQHGRLAKAGAAIVSRRKPLPRVAQETLIPDDMFAEPPPKPLATARTAPYKPFETGLEDLEDFDTAREISPPIILPTRVSGVLRAPPAHHYPVTEKLTGQFNGSRADDGYDDHTETVGGGLGRQDEQSSDAISFEAFDTADIAMEQRWQPEQTGQHPYDIISSEQGYEEAALYENLDQGAIERTLDFQSQLDRYNPEEHAWLFHPPQPDEAHAGHQGSSVSNGWLSAGCNDVGLSVTTNPAAQLGLDVGPSEVSEPLESRLQNHWKLPRSF